MDSKSSRQIGAIVILTIFCLGASLAFAGTSVYSGFNTINIGQTQLITATVTNGVAPYTYNFLVYNSLGSLAENELIQGADVVVFYNTGNLITFTAPSNTNQGRGLALLNAISTNGGTPSTIYLQPETYDVGNMPIAISSGMTLQGTGERQTTILSNAIVPNLYPTTLYSTNPIEGSIISLISTGRNITIADLSIMGTGTNSLQPQVGIGGYLTNTIIRNVFVYASGVGIMTYNVLSSNQVANSIIQNSTITTNGVALSSWNYPFTIEDSTLISTENALAYNGVQTNAVGGTPSWLYGPASPYPGGVRVSEGATTPSFIYMVNSIVKVSRLDGLSPNAIVGYGANTVGFWQEGSGSGAYLYAVNIITPTSNAMAFAAASGYACGCFETNALTTYNTLQVQTGTNVIVAGGYGAYSYSKNPASNLNAQTFSFVQPASEGTWTVNVMVNNVSNQPDVLVQYSNGTFVGYNSTSNTDVARGQALLNAFYGATPFHSAIPFVSNGATSTTLSVNVITTGGNPKVWLCGVAEGGTPVSPNPVTSFSVDVYDNDWGITNIGHQYFNGCNTIETGGGSPVFAEVGIGIDTIIPYGPATTESGDSCGGYCTSLPFTFSTTYNSFTAIIVTCASIYFDNHGGCDGSSGSITGIPSGCVQQQLTDQDGQETAALYTCNSLQQGTYTVTATNNNGGADMSMAAYTFVNVSNVASGETIYLKAENYSIYPTSTLLQLGGAYSVATNVALYGAGKSKTNIIGHQNGGMIPGINSILADLSIYGMNYESLPTTYPGGTYGNDITRNVGIYGYIDGIYMQSIANYGNVVFYNTTITSSWDTFQDGVSGYGAPNAIMFDSILAPTQSTSPSSPGGQVRGAAVYDGSLILVNTNIIVTGNVVSCGSIYVCAGIDDSHYNAPAHIGNVLVYGGSITMNLHGVENDIYAIPNPPNKIAVNSTLVYNALNIHGTVNTIGSSPYGAYTYQKYPMTPPGNWQVATETYMVSSPSTTSTTTIPTTTIPQSDGGTTGGQVPTSSIMTTTSTATTSTVPTTTIITPIINSTYNVTSSPENVTILKAGTITLSTQTSSVQIHLLITNVTNTTSALASNMIVAAFNVVVVTSENVIVNQTITLSMTLKYPCSTPPSSIAPYKLLSNGNWMPITPFTVNSASCTVSFRIPPDPTVALFQSTRNVTTSVPTTTLPTTSSVPTTTIPQSGQSQVSKYVLVAAVVIVVILAVAYYLLTSKNSRRKS